MTDDPLKQMFEEDARGGDAPVPASFVPATDPAFRLEVMSRIATRRFYISLAQRAGLALILTLIIVAIWPAVALISVSISSAMLLGLATLAALGTLAFAAHWVAGHVVARRR